MLKRRLIILFSGIFLAVILGGFLIINLTAKTESLEKIHERLEETEFIFLQKLSAMDEEDDIENLSSKVLTDENEIKEIVEIFKTTEVIENVSKTPETPLASSKEYKLIFYNEDGNAMDEYVFDTKAYLIKRAEDKRIFYIDKSNYASLNELLTMTIQQEPNFSLLFETILDSPKEIMTFKDGRTIYSMFEKNEIFSQDYSVKTLQEAFGENETLLNRMISYMQYVDALNDGGTIIFKAEMIPSYKSRLYVNQEIYLATCNTLSGNRDIYVGADITIAEYCGLF